MIAVTILGIGYGLTLDIQDDNFFLYCIILFFVIFISIGIFGKVSNVDDLFQYIERENL